MDHSKKSGADIRLATLDDVIGIVYVQATTWISSYHSRENGISEEDIRSLDFKSKIINWQHIIRSPNYQIWVAADKKDIVAFIAVLKESHQAEIHELCVLPEYQGQQLGEKLWHEASQWIDELPIKVRIVSYHEPSAAFYKSLGFKVSTLGEVDFITLPSGKNIPTVEMRRGEQPAETVPASNIAGSEVNKQSQDGQAHQNPYLDSANGKLVGRAELAKISGVRASTIKYYTEIGLLPFEQAEARLARRYNQSIGAKRLSEIQQMRNDGLSIKEIQERLQ